MLTILLAEDDIDDQELLAEAFYEIDPSIKLVSFTTGKNFLSYLDGLNKREMPGMIIVDYNIPEINGAEILRRLETNQQFSKITKLVWSTSDSPLYENSCLQLGAKAYLVKPSSISGLSELAKKMLSFADVSDLDA
jgi:CheY-like chemotaxis protein